jgi:hypothetical protein
MNDMTWDDEDWIAERRERGLSLPDWILLSIFIFGIYTGYSLQLTPTIPFPSVLAGFSGLALLFRRRDRIEPRHVAGLALVTAVLLVSVFVSPDFSYLGKRFTGMVQMVYSLVIGYALFLTMLEARRDQLAIFFLSLCVIIFIGCVLEDYAGLRPISDAVRAKFYSDFVYDADLRDELLYGRVRPKLFTSEPSAVTFGYTLFSFVWLMTSRWRAKVLIYFVLFGLGVFIMPGPTLLLMLLMLAPYQFFAGRAWTPTAVRFGILGVFAGAVIFGVLFLGSSVFSARVNQLAEGADASSFYRIQGPALVAMDVMEKYPATGVGLTSEASIADDVLNVYRSSKDFDPAWQFDNTFEVLTNYFWLHWIYFGVVLGTVVLFALSFWFKMLGIPSLWFCWIVWAILGQASGAYVGPKTWAVIFMAGAAAILSQRRATEPVFDETDAQAAPEPDWPMLPRPSAAE